MSLVGLEKHEVKKFEEFEENLRRYSERRAEYRKRYKNEYVAVLDGKVIAHALDLKTLFGRSQIKGVEQDQLIIDFLGESEKLIL